MIKSLTFCGCLRGKNLTKQKNRFCLLKKYDKKKFNEFKNL